MSRRNGSSVSPADESLHRSRAGLPLRAWHVSGLSGLTSWGLVLNYSDEMTSSMFPTVDFLSPGVERMDIGIH
jgi:hypothetical protein